jgi:hypothetical protein
MSTALAIAGVTQVLKDLLNDGLINHDITGAIGTTVTVTALPPDRIETAGEATQLNLYMYYATLNQGWRNESLPALNSRGERISNPPLALDLHYLLSAYTSGTELHMEVLLGYGMQLLHENPVLSRQAIRRSLDPPSDNINVITLPVALRAFSASGLAEQLEQIKITPEQLDTEEISKLWTAFSAKYRPTASYRVTVVLIESQKPVSTALPVQQRNIYVVPFKEPIIESITSEPAAGEPVLPNQPIFADSTIIVRGRQLWNFPITVNVGGVDVTPAPADVTDSVIRFPMPPDVTAGLQSLQVIHPMLMGSPPVPHKGTASRAQPFLLSPYIVGDGERVPLAGALEGIKLKIKPAITSGQNIRLLLNAVPPAAPASYVFFFQYVNVMSPPSPTEDMTVPVSGVPAGNYLMRVQVDGAESPLMTDTGTGLYNAPRVTI